MSLLRQNNRKKILLGQDGNSLFLLIVINVIIFIFLSFIKIVYLVNNSTEGVFQAQVINMLSLPGPPQVFATRPGL
jgi:TM2 domain-containing membrane protein YozV